MRPLLTAFRHTDLMTAAIRFMPGSSAAPCVSGGVQQLYSAVCKLVLKPVAALPLIEVVAVRHRAIKDDGRAVLHLREDVAVFGLQGAGTGSRAEARRRRPLLLVGSVIVVLEPWKSTVRRRPNKLSAA